MHEVTLLNKIVANMASVFYGNAHEPFELEEIFSAHSALDSTFIFQ